MPQPTPYTRSFDFTGYQENFPAQPLPGAQVDSNLDLIQISILQIIARLGLIQRDDGLIKNGVVTSDSFASSALALMSGFTPRGNWAATTAYAVGDLVNNSGFTYVCHTAHTSAGSFADTNWVSWAISSTAADVDFTPAGNIAADNVQDAIEELDAEKQAANFLLLAKGSTIASGATVNIGAADSDYIEISGTSTISSFGATTTRNHVWTRFTGALQITHNATSLILPGGANITTEAGDVFEWVRISGSNWICVGALDVNGLPLAFKDEDNMSSNSALHVPSQQSVKAYVDGLVATLTTSVAEKLAIAAYPSGCVLSGGVVSNGTDATNDLNISAFTAISDDGTTFMNYVGGTIETDAVFDDGSNNKGLDTGTVGNNTYHIWAIHRPDTGVTKVIASLSASAPSVLAAYTKKKRIDSVVRVGGALKLFTKYEIGGGAILTDYKVSVAATTTNNPGTSAVTQTLADFPTGFKFKALLTFVLTHSAGIFGIATSMDQTDTAPSTTLANLYGDTDVMGTDREIITNTSAQVRYRLANSTGSTDMKVVTRGYIDSRVG